MKAIKKWLFDKEGLFIIITWWFIAFVIFTIMLVSSINSVSKNLEITAETSSNYVHEFIESGDNVIPYNENVASVSVGKNSEGYKLDIRQYNRRYTVNHTAEIQVIGSGSVKGVVSYDIEVIEQYYISYNYSTKQLSINLLQISKEVAPESFPATLKKTESNAIHVLWDKEDTGIEVDKSKTITFGKSDEYLVVNGEKTSVLFYGINSETGKEDIVYEKTTPESAAKVIPFELVVEYKINTKEFTTKKYSTDGLNEAEIAVVNDAANFYTQMIEGSIGINASSFTMLIVSAVADAVLVISGIVGIVVLKRSKED